MKFLINFLFLFLVQNSSIKKQINTKMNPFLRANNPNSSIYRNIKILKDNFYMLSQNTEEINLLSSLLTMVKNFDLNEQSSTVQPFLQYKAFSIHNSFKINTLVAKYDKFNWLLNEFYSEFSRIANQNAYDPL